MYLTQEMTRRALVSMRDFHRDLSGCFHKHSLTLEENTGRRNAYLSQAQEAFFSGQLKGRFPLAHCDGRTGRPDIVIPEIGIDLECKLTSPSPSGGLSFQADGDRFGDGERDFLYVVADGQFENFVVLHFQGLRRSDFSATVASSRGKAKMRKSETFNRCRVLHGEYTPKSVGMLAQIRAELASKRPGTRTYQKLLERKDYWENPDNESFSVKYSPV